MSCFCEGYIIESDDYAKLLIEFATVKEFDLWYRNQNTSVITNNTGNWPDFLSTLAGLLTTGDVNQTQYDCLIIQYHYLDGDEVTRELINRLTDVYDRTIGSNIHKTLYIPGEQIGIEQYLLMQAVNSHYIKCAYGESLDNLAGLLNLTRETGETDEQFRARILAKMPGYVGGGTRVSIKKAISEFLGISEDDVYVIDEYLVTGNYGHFTVAIDIAVTPGVGQTYARIVQLINEIKAAGTVLDGAGFIIQESVLTSESWGLSVATNFIPETQNMTENTPTNMFLHKTDITYTDSLNKVK